MPRDNDKNNGPGRGTRGRPPRRGRDAGSAGKGGSRSGSRDERPARSAAPRGGDKKFGDKKFGEKRPYTPRGAGAPRSDGPRPRFNRDDRPRDDRPQRDDRPDRGPRKEFGARDRGEGRPPFKPREDRGARPFSPRNRDDSAPRRERSAGDGRFEDKKFGEKRPYTPRGAGAPRNDSPRPRFNRDDRPRDDRPQRDERPDRGPRKEFGARDRGEGRPPFKPREDRGARPFSPRNRDDSAPRRERSAGDGRFEDKKFGEKRPYTPRGGAGAPRGDGPRPRFNREDRPQRDERPDRGPRKEFGARDRGEGRPPFKPREDRGGRPFSPRNRDDSAPRRERSAGDGRFEDKKFGDKRPYTPRGAGAPRGDSPRPRFNRDDRPREDRPQRDERPDRGPRKFDRPREDRPDRERSGFDRPRFDRPRFDKPREDRAPRDGRNDWQEHPRSEGREERPRRDNEDDSKIFAKRPAFGGRGAYRERPDTDRRAERSAAPEKKKTGERIAKIVSRAGLCSRRDAEDWIVQGRVAVNGRVINSPALDVTSRDVVTIDGKPLPARERTRLFLFHKPRGLMTTHSDPEGRPTVFDNLPEGLPRLISIGRLDFNTEGLLLLTNDGGLARALELPDTGWLRRYRVRAHGEVTQAQLDVLKKGVEVDGVKYGSIDATLERDSGANVWVVFAIREGKNREVRNVMAHLGLEVNRLIRVSYGPFQLGEIGEGEVEEVKTRVLREQLGEKIIASTGAEFAKPVQAEADDDTQAKPKSKRVKPLGKSGLIADRKGRRVLVQRSGSAEARTRNEDEANGYGPPRRPQRGYKGKRDLKPRDE